MKRVGSCLIARLGQCPRDGSVINYITVLTVMTDTGHTAHTQVTQLTSHLCPTITVECLPEYRASHYYNEQ